MMRTLSAHAEQISYEDLYARWERGNWSATEIDFSRDRDDWKSLSTLERRAALWNYSLFLHGEDIVATDLAPMIDAAPREEQRYFLATQQADEARHAVFFKRFMAEVVGAGDGSAASTLDATRAELTFGFRKTFAALDRITGALRRDRSPGALAKAIFMYHFVVEATLAQPGQHFIESYLDERGILPGFRSGMRNVSFDEQRHIAFGVRMLHDLNREHPGIPDAVADVMREVTPYAVALFVPPKNDRRYTEVFGVTLEEVFEEGARSLEQKLRAAGMPLESLPGPIPFPIDIPPRERAERGIAMVMSGILGEGSNGPPPADPKTMELLFDSMRRNVDHRKTPSRPVVLQWEFPDADPWHVRIDNGASAAHPGRAEDADVTFECRYADWVDVIGRRTDPLRLIATGRLRPRGSLRTLLATRRMFAR